MANVLSQEMAEVLNQVVAATVQARVSQNVAEVLASVAVFVPKPIGTTSRWYGDLWGTDPEEAARFDMGLGEEWPI